MRLRLEPVDWPRAFPQAESLARRFSPALLPGSHDLVLVAAAVTMAGTWSLSFGRNSRQRPLAAANPDKVASFQHRINDLAKQAAKPLFLVEPSRVVMNNMRGVPVAVGRTVDYSGL